jgi:hypothetical protein
MDKDRLSYPQRVDRAATHVPRQQDPRHVRRIGQHEIVIGIPYRDEAFGEAILKDIDVVAEGTQCRGVVIRPGQTLGDVHVDALFFPGGRSTSRTDTNVKGNSSRWPRSEQKICWRLIAATSADHDHQQAEQRNIPILGVCGGSRRLATAKGATQSLDG